MEFESEIELRGQYLELILGLVFDVKINISDFIYQTPMNEPFKRF